MGTCPACGDIQFAKKQVCRKCGTPRPQDGGLIVQSGFVAGTMACGVGEAPTFCVGALDGGIPQMPLGGYPPDWNCPNCGDLQFSRNIACRRCGTLKPDQISNNVAALPPAMLVEQAPISQLDS